MARAGGPPQPWRGGEGAADPLHLPQRGRRAPLHLPEREATEARQWRRRARRRLRVLEPHAPTRSETGIGGVWVRGGREREVTARESGGANLLVEDCQQLRAPLGDP